MFIECGQPEDTAYPTRFEYCLLQFASVTNKIQHLERNYDKHENMGRNRQLCYKNSKRNGK